ncbi:MAG: apolipoprotein N-acyltransferase [Verrucomicrobiia bacterium]
MEQCGRHASQQPSSGADRRVDCVGGISFMVVGCNVILLATFWRFVLEIRRGKIRAHFDFTVTLLGLVGVFLFGADRLRREPAGVELKVAAIQTNIPLAMRRDPEAIPELLRIHEELTDLAAATGPDLIIWPEAAIPGGILIHWDTRAFIEHCASLGDFALMHGTLDAEGEKEYNAVALLPRDRSPWQIHHKIHLVPFGEYIPFRNSFPLFAWVAGDLVPGDFHAGTSWTLLDLKESGILIGPLICFEDTLDDLVRRFALAGAHLLVNVTNDAWFLESSGSHQHFVNARLRAIETRLPMVRAANTGVTAVIDPWGREKRLQKADGSTFLRGYLTETIQVPVGSPETTFFTRHGPVFSQGALGLFLMFSVVNTLRHKSMGRRSPT